MTMNDAIAEVRLSCGRYHLWVGGIVVAMEGDKCRDGMIPESVLPPIPPEELEHATIGGKPAKDQPIGIVRWFRGDNWTKEMLDYAAGKINSTEKAAREKAEGELAKYQRWEQNRNESEASLNAQAPCGHPVQLKMGWEDGKVHCWECEWMQQAARLAELQGLVEAVKAIIANPYGCPFCHSGMLVTPGNSAKDHDEKCGFAMAAAALARIATEREHAQ